MPRAQSMGPKLRGLELKAPPPALSARFSKDEPAKVRLSAMADDFEPAKVPVTALREDFAPRDVEKECLYAENAALKECLMLQQNSEGWLWDGDWGEDWGEHWCHAEDWCQEDWSGEEDIVQLGSEVVFQGLQRAQDLNGVHAVVERWDDDSQRWVVRLASGEEKFARPENLAAAYWSYCDWQGYEELPFPRNSSCNSFLSTASGGTSASFMSSWEEEMKTTVMMRNLPNDYTREMLLNLLEREGFRGCYDLLYLPIDYSSEVGFGYAFINLVSHAEAERFRKHFKDFASWDVVSQKVCDVSWSTVLQGVRAHVERYRNSPVMHEAVRDEFKPVLFADGERVPFPAPTKSIRAPRARRRDGR